MKLNLSKIFHNLINIWCYSYIVTSNQPLIHFRRGEIPSIKSNITCIRNYQIHIETMCIWTMYIEYHIYRKYFEFKKYAIVRKNVNLIRPEQNKNVFVLLYRKRVTIVMRAWTKISRALGGRDTDVRIVEITMDISSVQRNYCKSCLFCVSFVLLVFQSVLTRTVWSTYL